MASIRAGQCLQCHTLYNTQLARQKTRLVVVTRRLHSCNVSVVAKVALHPLDQAQLRTHRSFASYPHRFGARLHGVMRQVICVRCAESATSRDKNQDHQHGGVLARHASQTAFALSHAKTQGHRALQLADDAARGLPRSRVSRTRPNDRSSAKCSALTVCRSINTAS